MTQHIALNVMKAEPALGLDRYAASQNIKLSSLVKLVCVTVLRILQYGYLVC